MKALILLSLFFLVVACGKPVDTKTSVVNAPVDDTRMVCKLYDLTGLNTSHLPDYSIMSPIDSIKTAYLDNPVTNSATSFQLFSGGAHNSLVEQFGLSCEGTINIDTQGSYNFYTNSDDGTILYLNGIAVINNDNQHAMTKKGYTSNLLKGQVKIRVDYFNQYGDKGLTLSLKRPNASFEEVVKF